MLLNLYQKLKLKSKDRLQTTYEYSLKAYLETFNSRLLEIKKMTKTILILSMIALWIIPSFGQIQEKLNVTESKVMLLGKTAKLSELIDIPATEAFKKNKFKKNRKTPNNFHNRTARKLPNPELEHQGVDPLRSLLKSSSASAELEILVNRNGISIGSRPHDPTGSIGENYYLQAVNATSIRVFNKDGTVVKSFSGNTLWSELNLTSRGDPIIVYDQELSKWIITEFTDETSLLIAVSETSDPLGSYYVYEFVAPNFPDYPKYGIWNDHFVVTTNELGPGQLHQYFIDRHALMRGDDEVRMQRASLQGTLQLESPILITVPVDYEGNTLPSDPRPMVLRLNDSSWGQSSEDGINIYHFSIDYDDPTNTTFETNFIATTPYDGYPCTGPGFDPSPENYFDCLPQKDGINITAIPETIMNTVQFRDFGTHESIVLAFITDVTNGENLSGIRWMELRKYPEEGQWTLYQEGTYSPDDTVHRFLPSIAIDRAGCISIAYSTTSEDEYVGLRMTGRCADDPIGEMTVPEFTIVDGLGTLESLNRYGDYSHMSVDPTDELTMWFTSEYAGNGLAQTRIISFRLTRDSIDLKMTGVTNLQSGVGFTNEEIIDVAVLNQGKSNINSYEIGYILDGVQQESFVVNEPIASKDTVVTSFTVPVDLSARGEYNITTFVNYIDDPIRSNDTTVTKVFHYSDYDAELNILPMFSDCGIAKIFDIEVTNRGAITIEQGEIELRFNNEIIDTLNWNFDLETLESRSIEYDLQETISTENILEATFINTLTEEEFTPTDNTDRYSFGDDFLGVELTLTILPDESPEETTWEIKDQVTGEIIQEGGPYVESINQEEKFCLDPDRCYVFTMFDAGGDGMCCDNGTGTYSLSIGEETVFNGNFIFTSEDIHGFCPGNLDCSLIADYNLGFDEMTGNILINASGGVGPYSYSIDGGVNFQEENFFDYLEAGEYHIVVLDADGQCSYEEMIQVDQLTATSEINHKDLKINVRPNPTEGVFNVDIEGANTLEQRLQFQILNATGKIIQERKMAKYDDVFTTQISLLDYPDGIYYLRLMNEEIRQLTKIIKQ